MLLISFGAKLNKNSASTKKNLVKKMINLISIEIK